MQYKSTTINSSLRIKHFRENIKMNKFFLTATLVLISTFFLAINSNAGNLDVKPGQWNFVLLIDISESNTPIVQTRSTCFTKSQMNPFETFKINQQNTGCSINNVVNESGDELTWRWFCQGDDVSPKTNGKGKYISSGSEILGLLKTTHFNEGNLISTVVNIEGEYVGECATNDNSDLLLTKK